MSSVQDCIIGSGPAAAVLALRLAEAGRSVVVLEEGLGELPTGPTAGYADQLVRDGGLRATDDGGLTLFQGRGLGGSATIGHGICERLEDTTLAGWQRDHGWSTGWDLAGASRRAMTWMGASPLPEDGHNRNNTLLMEGARSVGLSVRSLAVASGTGLRTVSGSLGGPLATVIEAAGRAGADFRARHRVARLGRDGATITEATGAGFGVLAERFILCAGAIQGASLLHGSGIGSSGLGRGLWLIHRFAVLARFDDAVRCLAGGGTTAAAADRAGRFFVEPAAIEPAVAAAHTRLPLPELRAFLGPYDHIAAAWCVVPGGTGDLSWGRGDRRRLSRSFGPEQRELAKEAMIAAARAFLAAGAREVLLPVEGLPTARSYDDLSALRERALQPGDVPALCQSPQGGCRAGDGGPVGPDLRLRGTDNLYVCDASIFPTAVGPRAMVPVLTMGELLADALT